ncbi:MAG: hypothetical protein GAK28_03878 [Luteibacter sp.]|uniref:FliH/SctL family protein n=1 Tax=Luteibacter sp. TaxID=1886636 RepID=UPI00137DE906|nr:hypothetical protein [Luteibacter sp.]KAF1004676.1 MAG: hypothetical protein GAK28_03878 [Luteibacter sp.]
MTLLKAAQVSASAQRLNLARESAPTPAVAVTVPTEAERRLARVEEALREALAREEMLRRQNDEDRQEAHEQGRIEGERIASERFQRDWNQRSEAFLDALQGGIAQVDRRFTELEAFALDLAETALARVIGDAGLRPSLLAATIAHHVGDLAADTVIAIHVSVEDVEDAEALAATLPPSLASRLRVSSDVGAGECLLELKSGRMDIGLDMQARQLALTMERLRSS